MTRKVAAIITGAGSGSRLGQAIPKALVLVRDEPMVIVAARNVLASGVIDQLIVTAPDGYQNEFIAAFGTAGISATIVTGGASRTDSIAAALGHLTMQISVVLVHDAARPFASPAFIAKVAESVTATSPAVIPALPVIDTIKEVRSSSDEVPQKLVVATPDRSAFVAVQTPQGFTRDLIEQAYGWAAANPQFSVTDDASLVEALGVPVTVVAGESSAMKITTPFDLLVAELLAQ